MPLSRIAFPLLTALILLAACSKDNDVGPNGANGQDSIPVVNPPVISPPQDTLGTGWSRISSPALVGTFFDVFFVNNSTGYVSGDRFISKSTDGGLTWTKLPIPGELLGRYLNIYFTDADHGWMVSDNPGMILRTTDGGTTWKKSGIEIRNFVDVQFLDQQRGYAAGNGLWKTVDSGNTWTQTAAPVSLPVLGLYFRDTLTGWIGSASKLMKTENAGGAFTTQQTSTDQEAFMSIQFVDAQRGWAIGEKGLWKTVNSGTTWTNIIPHVGWGQGDLHFFDDKQGYIMNSAAIYKTTDGGSTLTRVLWLVKSGLLEIHFTDPQHGWAINEQSGLYRYAP
jgi:photosystem II stability/assembly factor-like uncharacterized protein